MPFQIVRNDITKMQVDAIVNTANPLPVYGSGIDTAVYEAAGREKLLAKRQEIGTIARGSSVITDGYDLPAKYIIHTVGTAWHGGKEGEEEIIRSCYRSVFKVAVENGIESLAIPLLASGSYGFPKGIALRLALTEIETFMAGNDMDVFLVVFDEKSFALSSELYGDIDEYINDNYVEEKAREEYTWWPGSARRAMRKITNGGTDGFLGGAALEPLQNLEAPTESIQEAEASTASFHQPGEVSKPKQKAAAKPPRTLDDVVKNLDKSFMELVFSFADAKGLTDLEVQKRANLDRKAFSKLKCGTTKNPSKATALALAIALELDLDDTKDLLSRAGLALSPCSKQDLIVQYFIEKRAYDIFEINVALFDHGEQPLGYLPEEMSPGK